ncbi:MAG: hypothetical protein JJT78_13830 [Leptospira sp.]|nr:hypothetical protein [Leptospira sp.]
MIGFKRYNNEIYMNTKYFIRVLLLIGIGILNTIQCSRYTISSDNSPDIKNQKNINIKKNLGVAIVFPFNKTNLDMFTFEELVSQVKNGFLNLEYNDQIIPENIEWIDTILDASPFDYIQDYRNSPKKNILEVQVEFDQHRVNSTFWINFLTMGIFPSFGKYNVNLKGIYYDSQGNRTHLDGKKTIVLNQIRSWFLYPLSFIENDSAYKMLKFYILDYIKESYSKIQEMNLAIGSYKTAGEPLEIPFRMRIYDLYCGKQEFSRNANKGGTEILYPVYDSLTYQICFVSLELRNHTPYRIYSNSTDFSIFAGGKRYRGLSEIEVNTSNKNPDKREYGTKDTINLNKQLKLDPKHTSSGVYGVYFLIPHEDVNRMEFIRWENKEISENPSEVWIGWDGSQD